MARRIIKAADLFCGAGGSSTGLVRACNDRGYGLKLLAVNHWDIAIETHSINHPEANHLCENLDAVSPRVAVPGGKLDILIASPECIHHSIARGGRPINDQSRASAWHVLRWCEALRVENVLIENVKEFQTWGPLVQRRVLREKWYEDGGPKYTYQWYPDKKKKGQIFFAFLNALKSLGYKVEYRVLNAADYGDPTSRERLFIMAKLGRKPIVWPSPTHASQDVLARRLQEKLFEPTTLQPHRPARDIIDWSIPGESIFNRKRGPLAHKTLVRIFAGLHKFCGLPFIVPNFGEKEGQKPRTHSLDKPLPAVTGHGAGALCEPFIVELRNNKDVRSIDSPLSTIATSGAHHGLCQPFVLGQQSGAAPRTVDKPLPTIATDGAISLVEPFLIGAGGPRGASSPRSIDEPMRTILSRDFSALVDPFLMNIAHSARPEGYTTSIDEPISTITTKAEHAIVQPYLVKYNGTGGAMSVDDPLDSITTKDRFGLVIPEIGAVLDIRFRMLQPHELAAAMSFPENYQFKGNREQRVKQIGNAVPVRTAQALCEALL